MQSAIDGFNVCIFAYGQTGSGKTFTMQGSESMPGIAPRALERLFNLISKNSAYEFRISCNLVELYRSNLRNLLADTKAGQEIPIKVLMYPSDQNKKLIKEV